MSKTKNNASETRRMKNIFSSSIIVTGLQKAAEFIYRKLRGSLIGGIFTSYREENAAAKSTAVHDLYKSIKLGGRVFTPAKQLAARASENSVTIGLVRHVLDSLLSSSMKSYGIFVFSAALYSAIVYVFRVFYFGQTEVKAEYILTLLVMLIASVIMIASRQTLAGAFLGSPIASFFIFKVVGIRKEALENREPRKDRFDIPFVAGLAFGIASVVIRPLTILLCIFALIIAYLVLIKPEFGVLLILTCLPFTPTMVLVGSVIYTLTCFLLKVARGKRSVKFDLLDALVLILLGLMLMGGVIACADASIRPALVYSVFMLGYFLVVNLIRSREWFMRCIVGVIISCAAVSVYGLFQNFFGLTENIWHDTQLFSDISGRVVSTFENPNVLAEYLIMTIPIILAALFAMKAPRAKLALGAALVCALGCLVYTWSRGAWLGFVIGIILFMLIYKRNTLAVLFLGAFAVPFLPFVLPQSIVQRFTSIGSMSDASTVYRVNIWSAVWEMIKDYWQSGIGIGEEAFAKMYRLYAFAGVESAPHSYNLYMQILVEIGIVGLGIFLALVFVWAQSTFTLHVNERRTEKLYSSAVFCGIAAVLAQGMTDYIWYNYRVFLMFWLLIGLGAAVRKTLDTTAEREIF